MKRLPPRALRGVSFTLTLLILEAVPVYAWLLVLAATQPSGLQMTAAPFWLVCMILALFALRQRWFGGASTLAYIASWTLIGAVAVLALARFSPLLYGSAQYPFDSASWLTALFDGAFDANSFVGLLFLTGYLGWRGAVVGGRTTYYSLVARRFWIALAATILALFGALAAQSSINSLAAELTLLLSLEGLVGLAALALGRPASDSMRHDARMPGAESSTRWLALSFIVAVAVVLLALVVGSLLDLREILSALSWLGPVGAAANAALYWLAQGFAYLLYLIFNPLVVWLAGLSKRQSPVQSQQPHPPTLPHKSTPLSQAVAAYEFLIVGVVIVLALVAVAVILFFIARAIANARAKASDEVDEEREALDARGLLRQQIRALLDGFRAPRPAAEHDDLQHDSARWLYREVMRAGARVHVERQPGETADEYATRLATLLRAGGFADAELLALTHAYDAARYGSAVEDPPAAPEMAAQARQALAHIQALQKAANR